MPLHALRSTRGPIRLRPMEEESGRHAAPGPTRLSPSSLAEPVLFAAMAFVGLLVFKDAPVWVAVVVSVVVFGVDFAWPSARERSLFQRRRRRE